MAYYNDTIHINEKSIFLEILNEKEELQTTGTGFIIKKENKFYLYTALHLVKGNSNQENIKYNSRKKIKINLKKIFSNYKKYAKEELNKEINEEIIKKDNSLSRIITKSEFNLIFDLYEKETSNYEVLMYKANVNPTDIIRIDVTNIIEKPILEFYEFKNIKDKSEDVSPLLINSNIYIIGYPYGISSQIYKPRKEEDFLIKKTEAFSFKRSISSFGIQKGLDDEVLFENPCYKSVSGAPVFDDYYNLVGIYIGQYEYIKIQEGFKIGRFLKFPIEGFNNYYWTKL